MINFPTGDFVTTSLIGSIDSSQDTATIGAGLTLPATNGVLVIDYDSSASVGASSGPETIVYATYDSGTGALAGITRGSGGTTGVSHANTASVQCSSSSVIYQEVEDRLDAAETATNTALADGWQSPAVTWTYASSTTITIPAGGATKYAVGDKVKLNQSIPLTAYFPLEDKDSDVGTFTVSNVGSPTYTAGKFSNALTLNGTNQALAITDAALLKPTGAFTIGVWIKMTGSAGEKFIFQSYSDNTNANGVRLYADADEKLVFGVGANSAYDSSTIQGTTAVDNNWHYVVVSSQENFTKIFLDGVLEASGYTVTPTYAATNYVRIGCLNNSGSNAQFFPGQIDDLFFINGHAVDQYWVAAKYAEATAQGTGNITATYQGYVTAVTDTLLTVTGGADYALYNGTITNPYYSKASSPVGFPANSDTFSPIGVNYAQVTANQGSISSAVALTGLTITCNVPTNSRIKITGYGLFLPDNNGSQSIFRIKEGSTEIQTTELYNGSTVQANGAIVMAIIKPTAGDHTYYLEAQRGQGAGLITLYAAATYPAFIKAEIV